MPKPLLQTPFPPSSVGPFNQSISSIVHQPRNIHRATSSSAVFLNVSYPPSPTQPIPQSNVLVHTIRHLLLPHASIPLLPIIKPTVAPIGFQSPPLDRLSQLSTTAICDAGWGPLVGMASVPTACVWHLLTHLMNNWFLVFESDYTL